MTRWQASAHWVGPGRGRKSTRPGASGVVELSPFEFLDRLADLVPRPRKHRHRYHGVLAPNHKLRSAVTAHDKRECRQAARCRDRWACGRRTCHRRRLRLMRQTALPRHLPTPKAKLMARVGEEFPFACPGCGGDIRLIAFITEPGPNHQTTAGRSRLTSKRRFASWRRPGWLRPRTAAPPPVSPARGPPADWGELVQVHDDRAIFQATDRRTARDRHSQPLTGSHVTVRTAREKGGFKAGSSRRDKSGPERG